MEPRERDIKKLLLDDGRIPFDEWFQSLDLRFRVAVDARLNRLRAGNFGDWKSVGKGVMELRIDKGPGLRVYLGIEGATLVVLIAGGDKGSQAKDIKRAQQLWAAWKRN